MPEIAYTVVLAVAPLVRGGVGTLGGERTALQKTITAWLSRR